MSDDKPLMLDARITMYVFIVLLVFFLLGLGLFATPEIYKRGLRYGACAEMCRPAKFDVDQKVNGGCLCVGSDKVLRFKKTP